jgi:hypothetical protein
VTFLGTWFAPLVILVLFVGLPWVLPPRRLWQATKNAVRRVRRSSPGHSAARGSGLPPLSPFELIGLGGSVKWR